MAEQDPINALENVLRDLIERVLADKLGPGWIAKLDADRVQRWRERQEAEAKQRPGLTVDKRLLYYSEFFDLAAIIHKHWDLGFKDCFGDLKALETDLSRLLGYRNPQAHSRRLASWEQSLVEGLCGLRRNQVTLFLSQGGAASEMDRYFARIEEVTDTFGSRVAGVATRTDFLYKTKVVLRVGDTVGLSGSGSDPAGDPLQWVITTYSPPFQLAVIDGADFDFTWLVTEDQIGDSWFVNVILKNLRRPYKRLAPGDDMITLIYKVLPAQKP